MDTELDPVFNPQHSERERGRKVQDRKERRRRRCRVKGGYEEKQIGGLCSVSPGLVIQNLDIHGSAGKLSASN